MKKCCLWAVLGLLVCLTACSSMVPSDYLVENQHMDKTVEVDSDALTAESYEELEYAVSYFVQNGIEHGVIRASNYDGDVTTDIAKATYEISKNDPLGAYAVDYMTHDCNQIISYYEIHVDITFRKSVRDMEEIIYVRSDTAVQAQLEQALENLENGITLRISNYHEDLDFNEMAQTYYEAHPDTMMELPTITSTVYPEQGTTRIAELKFTYETAAADLLSMRQAVASSLTSAVSYVRYRSDETEKIQLLSTYLLERFNYEIGTTSTPVYSLLCGGVADSKTFATVLQLLMDRLEVECLTVSGYLNGESHYWNILNLNGTYCHVDLMRCVMDQLPQVVFYADADMAGYSWDQSTYPACGLPLSTTEEPTPEETTAPGETSPSATEEITPTEPAESTPLPETTEPVETIE